MKRSPRTKAAVTVMVVVLAVALVASSGMYYFGRGPSGRDVIATVNGNAITRDELYERMYAEIGRSTLDSLIVEALIADEAGRMGVEVTDEDMDRALARFIAYFGSEDAFYYALAYYDMSLDQLKADLRVQILAEKCLADSVEVTEDEIRDFFEANKAAFGIPKRVTASHILVESEAEALEVLDRLAGGDSFEDLAGLLSEDPGSRDQGGSLGTFGPGDMVHEFELVAFALAVGEISDPVRTDFGYHIIRVDEHHPAVTPELDDVWDEVEAEVRSEKTSALIPEWIQDLRDAADIRHATD